MLKPYHDPTDEPTAPALDPSFFDFDNGKEQLSKEQLKGLYGTVGNIPMCLILALVVLIYDEVTKPSVPNRVMS